MTASLSNASSLSDVSTRSVPRPVLGWAPAAFLFATFLGVWMRFGLAGRPLVLPFDHLLHAHSHVLYFGWAALVILAVALPTDRPQRWAWWGLGLMPVMAAAFLAQGYGPVSIAVSTAVMVVWYGGIAAWWRSGQRETVFGLSFAYILIASLGVWTLAVLQATGNEGLASRLAIHGFLSGFAWSLVLGTAALLSAEGVVASPVARRTAIGWAIAAWALFPLDVIGGPEVEGLGWLARVAAFVVLVPTVRWVKTLWASAAGWPIRLAAGWLGAAVVGLAAVAVGGSELLTWAGRPGIVVYLHALLLGYVTTVLAWVLGRRARKSVDRSLMVHHIGLTVMLAGVALPLGGGNPKVSGWIAAAGALIVWGAAWWWAGTIRRRS